MTSFGVEWETNVLVCNLLKCGDELIAVDLSTKDKVYEIDEKIKFTLDVKSKDKIFTRKRTTDEGKDCLNSIEIDIGPIFNPMSRIPLPPRIKKRSIGNVNYPEYSESKKLKTSSMITNLFNIKEFEYLFNKFRNDWDKLLKQKYIPYELPDIFADEFSIKTCELHLVTMSRLTHIPEESDISNDCCFETIGSFVEGEKFNWAFNQSFHHIKGNPQITAGIPLSNMENIIINTVKYSKIWQKKHDSEEYKGTAPNKQFLWKIVQAYEMLQVIKRNNPQLFKNNTQISFILLIVIYEGLIYSNKQKSSYTKAKFFYKPRTNSRHMADVLLNKHDITLMIDILEMEEEFISEEYDSDIQNLFKKILPYITKWANPEEGIYLIFNADGSCGKLPKENINVVPELIYNKRDITNWEELSKIINYKIINYVSFYDSTNYNKLSYDKEIVGNDYGILSSPPQMNDIGEWYYGAGSLDGQANYIFECRRPLTVAQLLAVSNNSWDSDWNTPNITPSINIDDLKDLVKKNLDFFSMIPT